jgi:hypothetical protein
MRRLAVAAAALFSIVGADTARAQTSQVLGRDWENAITGRGIKVGEGTVLHPVAGIETGLINNVFYEEGEPINAGVIRIAAEIAAASLPPERMNNPGADYDRPLWRPWRGSIHQTYGGPFWGDQDSGAENPGAPPRLEFRAGARAFYEEYLSNRDTVRSQRNLGLNANAHLHLFPYDTFALTIDEDLTRAIRPTNFESSSDLDRWIHKFRLGARIQAGGRALIPELRYENRIDYFESDESQFANRLQQTLGLRLTWWLAQYTRFYADASIGFFGGLGDGGDGGFAKVSSMPLRLIAGANTALTEAISARLYGGYARGFYSAGPDFHGPLAGAQLAFRYSPFGSIALGYRYDFQDSINANFYSEHVGEARVVQQVGDRLVGEAWIAGHLRHYDGVPMSLGGGTSRDDVIFVTGVEGKYLLREWLGLNGTLHFASDQTDFRYDAGAGLDDPSFSRFELFLGLIAAY